MDVQKFLDPFAVGAGKCYFTKFGPCDPTVLPGEGTFLHVPGRCAEDLLFIIDLSDGPLPSDEMFGFTGNLPHVFGEPFR